MADISTELARILSAIYGEDVRGSIHDAIDKINNVSEVVLTTGTAVTSPSSSSTGFYDDSLYLNTDTFELWKCTGVNTWASQGTLKGEAGDDGNGIVSIEKTSTSGLVDTYTITYSDGTTTTFDITNGADGTDGNDGNDGVSVTGVSLISKVGLLATYRMSFSNGTFFDYTVSDGASGSGTGDMTKAVYDTDNDGIVDAAETLSGLTATIADLNKTANLATVATSGSYNDLSNKPTIPTVDQTYSATSSNAQSGKAVASAISGKVNYSDYGKKENATISNGIASFNSLEKATIEELVIDIDPVQRGSGDPSPSNVRPITGWTEAKVTRSGKNLCVLTVDDIEDVSERPWENNSTTFNGITYSINTDTRGNVVGINATGTLDGTSSVVTVSKTYITPGTYTFSGVAGASNLTYFIRYVARDDTGKAISIDDSVFIDVYESDITKTLPSNVSYVTVHTVIYASLTNVIFQPMIRLASDTNNTFETYTADIHTIDLNGTRYGGTLNVTTGVLTVTKAFATLTGANVASVSNGSATDIAGGKRINTNITGAKYIQRVATIISDVLSYDSDMYQSTATNTISVADDGYITLRFAGASTTEEAQTALNNTNIQVCYELATPTTVQLTAQEVVALLGTNNIFADTGDVTNCSHYVLGGDQLYDLKNRVDWDSQRVLGAKNLLHIFANTSNDISTVVNPDGSITSSGTKSTSGGNNFRILEPNKYMLPVGKYKISLTGNSNRTLRVALVPSSGDWVTRANVNNNEEVEFEITQADLDKTLSLFFVDVTSGTVVNWTYYPMLRLASDPDDTYVPYAMTNRELTKAIANIVTDDWTTTSQVQSDGTVTFTGLNDSYSYSRPYYELPSGDSAYTFSKVTKSGSGTSVTLIYTTDAPSGTVCKLRILK